ncbi:TPA: hypothetical protein DIV49_03555, partial [Candidatus Saccharibacteria bacterium]|nr:hypothetical protein [Candidatus Saccharibacteria bacterium]
MNTDVPQVKLNDGNSMPQLGLGVWKAANNGEAEQAVLAAIQTGYRLIDTAAVYMNEEDVGRAIASCGVPREELFITTKLWNSEQGAEKVRPALLASLEKLGLDYVDLYLIHWPMPARDLYVETWKEMEKLRDEGLIKSIGVSNFQIEHLEKLASESNTVPAVNQIELHPGFIQAELREYCAQHGIQVESWKPIGGADKTLHDNPVLQEIAKKYDKSAVQVAIRWHIQHGLVVIPKSVHEARIQENFDVFDFELSDDDITAIDALKGERQG